MLKWMLIAVSLFSLGGFSPAPQPQSWIRINMLGYTPDGIKVAVWCSKNDDRPSSFSLVNVLSGETVYSAKDVENFGGYGPFTTTGRLNFSKFTEPGRYVLMAGG